MHYLPVNRNVQEGGKRSSHLTVRSEVGFGLMHSSSTGDLYSATQPLSSLNVDMSSSDSENAAVETVLLGQQMQRCADSLVALRTLFMPDDSQGDMIMSLLY